MRQAVVLTTATMLIGATAAVAADLPPGTDVATLAEQAVTAVERAAHTADLTLTVSSAMRASTGERAYASTGTMTVHQAVQSATRSLGTMTEVSDPVDGTAQPPRTTRVTGIGDRLYLSGRPFDGQVVWVRPTGMPILNPADPTFRLPHPAQMIGLTAVSGEPGPFVRLRAQLDDAVVRAFAVSLRAGKSNRPVDRAAAANGTRFEERTIELVIDPATGRLVETDTRIAFAVDLNLISDWGSPITGDAVSAITSRFVPSPLAAAPTLRQPTDAISYAQFERNELSDALAQSLIGDAERAMSDCTRPTGRS